MNIDVYIRPYLEDTFITSPSTFPFSWLVTEYIYWAKSNMAGILVMTELQTLPEYTVHIWFLFIYLRGGCSRCSSFGFLLLVSLDWSFSLFHYTFWYFLPFLSMIDEQNKCLSFELRLCMHCSYCMWVLAILSFSYY